MGVGWTQELPSQFMENFCLDKPTLMGMARHVETGAPLPDELFDKLKAAKTFRAASAMLRQLHFATVDLELHARYPAAAHGDASIFDVDRRVAKRTTARHAAPPPPPMPHATARGADG